MSAYVTKLVCFNQLLKHVAVQLTVEYIANQIRNIKMKACPYLDLPSYSDSICRANSLVPGEGIARDYCAKDHQDVSHMKLAATEQRVDAWACDVYLCISRYSCERSFAVRGSRRISQMHAIREEQSRTCV